MRTATRDGLLAGGFASAFLLLSVALAGDGPLIDLDLAVHAWAEEHRPASAEAAARVLNRLGQGGALLGLSLLLAGWLTLRRHRVRAGATRVPVGPGAAGAPPGAPPGAGGWWPVLAPVAYVVVAALLVVPTVLAAKAVTDRGAPSSELPPEQTVALFGALPAGEYAAGYPGGHAVNAVVWYGVLLVLVTGLLRAYGRPSPPRKVQQAVRLVPPAVITVTTVYLSFHWLTDSLAGLLFGLAVDRLLAALRAMRAARRLPDLGR